MAPTKVRGGELTVGGLRMPLLAWDVARAALGPPRSTVCVSRRKVDGAWCEVRRYNAWRKGDDPAVIPPPQDALPALVSG